MELKAKERPPLQAQATDGLDVLCCNTLWRFSRKLRLISEWLVSLW